MGSLALVAKKKLKKEKERKLGFSNLRPNILLGIGGKKDPSSPINTTPSSFPKPTPFLPYSFFPFHFPF